MRIRPRIVATIWKKEISETLRDRRTLFFTIVLPVLLYPMMMMGFSRLAESESEATLAKTSTVAVWGRIPPALERELASRPRLTVRRDFAVPDEIRTPLAEGRMEPPVSRSVEP